MGYYPDGFDGTWVLFEVDFGALTVEGSQYSYAISLLLESAAVQYACMCGNSTDHTLSPS